ncbi:MAG: 50S ribosomal protein L19 [Candidatus Brocadiae bacterium]|nr:50S ribosomal protein L19 [Candidatus Brocadiia bacterium]
MHPHPVIRELEKEYFRKTTPNFAIGDTVDVHVKIVEGDRERIQLFNGIIIARKGSGARATFTVRRIVQGEGVERVFPVHSPKVADVVIKKRGDIRRAKLYYLRGRVGKGTRVKEKLVLPGDEKPAAQAPAPAETAKA